MCVCYIEVISYMPLMVWCFQKRTQKHTEREGTRERDAHTRNSYFNKIELEKMKTTLEYIILQFIHL